MITNKVEKIIHGQTDFLAKFREKYDYFVGNLLTNWPFCHDFAIRPEFAKFSFYGQTFFWRPGGIWNGQILGGNPGTHGTYPRQYSTCTKQLSLTIFNYFKSAKTSFTNLARISRKMVPVHVTASVVTIKTQVLTSCSSEFIPMNFSGLIGLDIFHSQPDRRVNCFLAQIAP